MSIFFHFNRVIITTSRNGTHCAYLYFDEENCQYSILDFIIISILDYIVAYFTSFLCVMYIFCANTIGSGMKLIHEKEKGRMCC